MENTTGDARTYWYCSVSVSEISHVLSVWWEKKYTHLIDVRELPTRSDLIFQTFHNRNQQRKTYNSIRIRQMQGDREESMQWKPSFLHENLKQTTSGKFSKTLGKTAMVFSRSVLFFGAAAATTWPTIPQQKTLLEWDKNAGKLRRKYPVENQVTMIPPHKTHLGVFKKSRKIHYAGKAMSYKHVKFDISNPRSFVWQERTTIMHE